MAKASINVKMADIPEVKAAFAELEAQLQTALLAEGELRAENDRLRAEVGRLQEFYDIESAGGPA